LAGKRVKVNLYRRGIFQSCVVATCDVSSVGVNISAETPLTQGRRCLSHFELRAKDVAAMRPLTSGEADFELELELDSIEWQERVEKVPPVVAQAGRHTWRRQSVEARQKPTASPLEIGAEEGCGRLNAEAPSGRGPVNGAPRPGSLIFVIADWQTLADRFKLSCRELEITKRVFDDHKENQIAAELRISPHTVHTHLGRIYRKVGVSGRAQLTVVLADSHIRHMP
jgi:DNA-binding CsgD family transcriptional regulator